MEEFEKDSLEMDEVKDEAATEKKGGLVKTILSVVKSKPFVYTKTALQTYKNWEKIIETLQGENYYFWFTGKAFGETFVQTFIALNHLFEFVELEPIPQRDRFYMPEEDTDANATI